MIERSKSEENAGAERGTPTSRTAAPGLQFALTNHESPTDPVIFTDAANDLVVQFGNPAASADAWELKGSAAVPSQDTLDPSAPAASVFYLSWPSGVTFHIPDGGVHAPTGWLAQFFETGKNAPYIGFTPSSDIALEPGESLAAKLTGLTAAGSQLAAANLELDGFLLLRSIPDSPASATVTMKLEPRPVNGKRELNLAVQFIGEAQVTLTPPGEDLLHSLLAISIRNDGDRPLIAAGSNPTQPGRIALSFALGPDAEPGVLASAGDAANFPLPSFHSGADSKWTSHRAKTADDQFFVEPLLAQNPTMLAPGEEVVILLDGLFSHNQVDLDSAVLTIRVSQLDGFNDTAYPLTIAKSFPAGILQLDVDANPIRAGGEVTVTWLIAGVGEDSVTLAGLPGGTLIGTQVAFHGRKVAKLTESATIELSTTAAVDDNRKRLAVTVVVQKPTVAAFVGRIAFDGTAVVVTLDWTLENCVKATLNGAEAGTGKQELAIRIGIDQLFLSSYTLTGENEFGETVSSTLEFGFRENVPRVTSNTSGLNQKLFRLPVVPGDPGKVSSIWFQAGTGWVGLDATDTSLTCTEPDDTTKIVLGAMTGACSRNGNVQATAGFEVAGFFTLCVVCFSRSPAGEGMNDRFPDGFSPIAWCAVTGDAKWLLAGSAQNKAVVVIAGPASGKNNFTEPVGATATVCELLPNDKGGYLIDGTHIAVFEFDDASGVNITGSREMPEAITSAAVSKDGLRLYCGGASGQIHLLHIDAQTQQLADSGIAPLLVGGGPLLSLCLPPSETHIVTSNAGGVHFVSLDHQRPAAVFSTVPGVGPAIGILPEILSVVVQTEPEYETYALLTPTFSGGVSA